MLFEDDVVVTETNLRFYYDNICPVRDLIRWISYGAEGSYSTLQNREISFTYQKDTGDSASDYYVRWQSFEGFQQFHNTLCKMDNVPFKFDIGAMYNKSVSLMQLSGGDFKAVERELVFDIDMNDYDDYRTCCSEKKVCHKCWRFIKIAVEILTTSLREDFGFNDILWVYSGRRGIHGWICDKEARQLPSEARSAIVDYLTLINASDGYRKRVNLYNCDRCPMVLRAFDMCYSNFFPLLQEQNFFGNVKHLETLLEYIPERHSDARDYVSNAINRISERGDNVNSVELFDEICNLMSVLTPREYASKRKEYANKVEAFPTLFRELVIAFCYPRLDVMVTRDIGHLLKSPFCIHAKTGRVCVPINHEKIDSFRPEGVPTLMSLRDYYDSSEGNMEGSPLTPYIRYFREVFLSSCLVNSTRKKNKNQAKNNHNI